DALPQCRDLASPGASPAANDAAERQLRLDLARRLEPHRHGGALASAKPDTARRRTGGFLLVGLIACHEAAASPLASCDNESLVSDRLHERLHLPFHPGAGRQTRRVEPQAGLCGAGAICRRCAVRVPADRPRRGRAVQLRRLRPEQLCRAGGGLPRRPALGLAHAAHRRWPGGARCAAARRVGGRHLHALGLDRPLDATACRAGGARRAAHCLLPYRPQALPGTRRGGLADAAFSAHPGCQPELLPGSRADLNRLNRMTQVYPSAKQAKQAKQPQPISYRIEVADAAAHRFKVTLRIARPQNPQLLSLPVWIPGSYLVREFARHLSPITATQGSRQATVTPQDKATWSVQTQGGAALTISYEVYAFDTSVRAAFLNAQRGFFNGTSVFLKAHGFEDQPQAVQIAGLPKGW